MSPITSSMNFMTLLVKDMAQTGAKLLLILARVEASKFLIPIKASGYLMAYWKTWHGYLKLLAIGAALLQYFLPPGTTWFKIHEYRNIRNLLFIVK